MNFVMDSLRLALFSGKGGVGKTTLSCGFARRWAKKFPDQQILLLSTDPAHSLGDVLQISVSNEPSKLADLPNLQIRALDAEQLLVAFKQRYGTVLELLVERGSFVEQADLSPVWDMDWPGLDELMGILEIHRLLNEGQVDRIVVDMAPSGHTLKLLGLMDFLDNFLEALELFQEKHRVISQRFTRSYTPDEADRFLVEMKAELTSGRQLLQDGDRTACLAVAIAEPMSFLETDRLLNALKTLQISCSGVFVNRVVTAATDSDRYAEQQDVLQKFLALIEPGHLFTVPQQATEPLGSAVLDQLITQVSELQDVVPIAAVKPTLPQKILPSLPDFIAQERRLILIGGKGGVGKTTIAASLAWEMAKQHPDRRIRVISIDPAHSLGDAYGLQLGHNPTDITLNLSAQEVNAEIVLDQFRQDYLWELAEMMSGKEGGEEGFSLAYGPQAWRQIVAQALPGIDEMLSLVAITELLDQHQQDLVIVDTAPTGHLLRFLEMPTALSDWLSWIFKLWLKYQDVLGRVDLMSRLRTLRQQIVQTQKKLKDANHTEFIAVLQAQVAIVSETQRLTESITQMGITQRYVVDNRCQSATNLDKTLFPSQTVVHLPVLPRSVTAMERIQIAASLLF